MLVRILDSLWLRAYLAASRCIGPLARRHLARRLARGREDAGRWREKMGEASLPRPAGPLIWCHAVGVGEVLALPALVAAVRRLRPEVSVLITSSSRTSALALAPNLPGPDQPGGAVHQFLPLDAAPFVRAFLDHWRPDLAVWAERDIWPGLVAECARRGVPQMLVNGRMDARSFTAKRRVRGLFAGLYSRMVSVGVQDAETAAHFAAFGVGARVVVDGSLKSGAAALADLPDRRAGWQAALAGRFVWLAASSHAGDEAVAAQAHALLRRGVPGACLIVAPRDPGRADDVVAMLRGAGFAAGLAGEPAGGLDALVVPRIGEMGLWYRLARVALVGGSIATVGGHNPYEPARLGCAVLHGPHVANFAADYAAFHAAGAARLVRDAGELAAALADPAVLGMTGPALAVAGAGRAALEAVTVRMVATMDAHPVAGHLAAARAGTPGTGV